MSTGEYTDVVQLLAKYPVSALKVYNVSERCPSDGNDTVHLHVHSSPRSELQCTLNVHCAPVSALQSTL